jgi:tetratricopeptide (TPR) repeat protein
MSRKWLVSFPIGQEDISRKEGENLRDFARRLVSNKKFDEALSVYLELLRHSPLDVGLLTNLSLVESKLESKIDRWQQSARFAELATRLDPNNVKAWYWIGV